MKTFHRCLLWTACVSLLALAGVIVAGNADIERALARSAALPLSGCGLALFWTSVLCKQSLDARVRLGGAIVGLITVLAFGASSSVLLASHPASEN